MNGKSDRRPGTRLDVHVHLGAPIQVVVGSTGMESKLDEILTMLRASVAKEQAMSVELDNLTVQVRRTTDLQTSGITLIRGLAQAIKDAKDDPAKLNALATELEVKATEMSAAIAEHTPVDPNAPGTTPDPNAPASQTRRQP